MGLRSYGSSGHLQPKPEFQLEPESQPVSRLLKCISLVAPLAAICAAIAIWLLGCGTHTSDTRLITFFYHHEASFERLVTMADEDRNLHAITRDSVMIKSGKGDWAVMSPHAISVTRWEEYQKLFKELNLPVGIVKSGQDVDFRIDNYSMLNGDSSKGFYYSPESPPGACTTELSACASKQRIGPAGLTVNRMIKPRWYLYLHYN